MLINGWKEMGWRGRSRYLLGWLQKHTPGIEAGRSPAQSGSWPWPCGRAGASAPPPNTQGRPPPPTTTIAPHTQRHSMERHGTKGGGRGRGHAGMLREGAAAAGCVQGGKAPGARLQVPDCGLGLVDAKALQHRLPILGVALPRPQAGLHAALQPVQLAQRLACRGGGRGRRGGREEGGSGRRGGRRAGVLRIRLHVGVQLEEPVVVVGAN